MRAHSCDLYAEPTDSDGDSADDDQADTDAVADAGAATVNATAATASETDNCELGVSGSAARTSPGAGAMRPSAILRIMYSSPGKYSKSVSYLSCGHHRGFSPLLTFDIGLFDI